MVEESVGRGSDRDLEHESKEDMERMGSQFLLGW